MNTEQINIMTKISKYDYIYRSLQAFLFIKDNPLKLTNSNHITNISNYIYMLLKTFFNG